MFSDSCKNQILWNYAFDLFEDEIHDMNKTRYSNFHTYTEAKNKFILAEERKSIKINKSSETKNPKDNSSGATNPGNNKNKESMQKKNYQQSNTNSSINKNSSLKGIFRTRKLWLLYITSLSVD